MQGTNRSGEGRQASLIWDPGSELRLQGRGNKKGEDDKWDGEKNRPNAVPPLSVANCIYTMNVRMWCIRIIRMPMSNTLISLLFLLSFAELCTELCTRCFSYDAHSVLFHVFFFPRYSSTSEFLESVLLFCDHGLDFGSGKHLPNEGTHKSLANKKSGKNLAKLINQFSNVSTIMYTRYTRAWPLLAKNICIRAGSTDRRNLDSSNVCTLVFSSCFFLVAGTKFGRVVLHYKTKKRLFFFFFFISWGAFYVLNWSFVGIVMKKNLRKFRFTTRKNRVQKKWFPGRIFFSHRRSKSSVHCSSIWQAFFSTAFSLVWLAEKTELSSVTFF